RVLIGADGKPLAADTAPFAALRRTDAAGEAIAEALHENQLAVRFSMRHVWGEQACL
ncbi:MAG: metal-dependent phosphohydrolase, partial [Burkholderiaceae bacterium]|nr:metal-dependent phosphohydrolase [Burkholderiaceae bacterium]